MSQTSRKRLEERWTALISDPLRPVFQLIDAGHPLDLYMGRSPEGNRLLLLITQERPPAARPMSAMKLEVSEREDGRWALLLRLLRPELSQVFAMLCDDLVEASRSISDPSRPLGLVMARFNSWQRLLERGTSGLLSEGEIRGLAGELRFLLDSLIPQYEAVSAVRCWEGPFGADRDFATRETSWEVKTVRAGAETVKIASERQLYSETTAIWLVVMQLDDAQDADLAPFTLNGLVGGVRDALSFDAEAIEEFECRLALTGFVARPEYERPVFQLGPVRRYKVDDDFPRIVPLGIPPGVERVRYEIRLSAIDGCSAGSEGQAGTAA